MELFLEGFIVNLSVYIKYGFISTHQKFNYNKVSKLLLLLLNNYLDTDNFLASRYIAKTVVSLSPSMCMYRYKNYGYKHCNQFNSSNIYYNYSCSSIFMIYYQNYENNNPQYNETWIIRTSLCKWTPHLV